MVKRSFPALMHKRARALRREMTEAERLPWRLLRSRQLDGVRFRRQVPIGSYIADFCSHEARLIIEVDGGQHDLASEQETRRTATLEVAGYRLLRFWNNDVLEHPQGVHAAIARALRAPAPTP